jgi:catechol 2,3-dioxygenase-like lactoylglutathione lyase family enzyme
MALSGVSHISLTVTDLAPSGQWYHEVLGWDEKMNGRSETTTFSYGTLPDGTTIVLRVHDEPSGATFDERHVGLDHLSLLATDAGDLGTVERRLQGLGAEYTPVQQLPYGQVLNFRDPDNIALELFYTP